MAAAQRFVPLPADEPLRIAWPTPNHSLLDDPKRFFARTRANADYGKPGFTRDCGERFHRGADITPVSVTATGKTTRVIFTDCVTHRDYESDEPTFVPHDEIFSVYEGVVREVVTDESASDFGKHVVAEHTWPRSRAKFYTLYAHLAATLGTRNPVKGTWSPTGDFTSSKLGTGDHIGRMGQTSRSADARNWMAIAPHLHFEVRNADGEPYDPAEFLKRFLT